MAHTLAVGRDTLRRTEKAAPPYRLPEPGRVVRGYIYDMEIYLRDCVDRYCKQTGVSHHRLKMAHTQFIDEKNIVLGRRRNRAKHGLDPV